MVKINDWMKIEALAADALRSVFAEVPAVERLEVQHAGGSEGVDFIVEINVFGRKHRLVAEVKSSGQPRYVRSALMQLDRYVRHQADPVTPIFIAPYLSPEAQNICREHEVGYLDLEGNARLAFGSLFISRQVASKPVVARRDLRSIFRPKSAQIIRQMLSDPAHPWRVVELAEAAGASLGLVSKIRNALLDREWAKVSDDGILLSAPDAVLDAWVKEYEPPSHDRLGFYTTLHGSSLDQAVRALHSDPTHKGKIALASFSAAQWLAPYGRTGRHYFYADEEGIDSLRSALKLTSASKGENVIVDVLDDPALLLDTVEPTPGIICTSPVQTYLDLSNFGERGQEAAAHLRREKLRWTK